MYKTWNGLQYMRSMPSPRDWMNKRNRKLLLLFETCDRIVRSSTMNMELNWLLYMVSTLFRGCILWTIIHTGKTRFNSVNLCCTCHAVLSISPYVYCDVPTAFFHSVFKYWWHTHSSIYTDVVLSDDSTDLCNTKNSVN